MLNRSIEGKSLLIRGRTYVKGVGMRAPSNIRYPIMEEYDRFVALAGIDGGLRDRRADYYRVLGSDAGNGYGCLLAQQPSVQFRVFIDGQLAAESPPLKPGQEPCRFDTPIPPGSRQINLAVTDAGSRSVLDLAVLLPNVGGDVGSELQGLKAPLGVRGTIGKTFMQSIHQVIINT